MTIPEDDYEIKEINDTNSDVTFPFDLILITKCPGISLEDSAGQTMVYLWFHYQDGLQTSDIFLPYPDAIRCHTAQIAGLKKIPY